MDRTALVTGMDTNAVARAVCSRLLMSGYQVVATSEDQAPTGGAVGAKFHAEHSEFPPVVFEAVDFASATSVSALVARLCTRSYDVVVNCASTLASSPEGNLRDESVDFDYAEFTRVLQYNVTAVAAICLGLKEHIKPGGAIINVTSTAGREGAFATMSYNASKAAVDNLTRSLANTLGAARGVRVNSIAPGWIPPSPDAAGEGVVALANALTPSVVAGEPSDVAGAVLYLIDASFQNGTVLSLDGGVSSSYLAYLLESLELQGVPIQDTISSLTSLISQAKRSRQ